MPLFLDLGTCCSEGQRHLYCRPKGLVEKPHEGSLKEKQVKGRIGKEIFAIRQYAILRTSDMKRLK